MYMAYCVNAQHTGYLLYRCTSPTCCCYTTVEINQVHDDTCKLKTLRLLLHSLQYKFNCTSKRVQVQLLQQMFKMSSFFLHADPKSLPPFVISIINDTLWQSVPCVSQALLQIGQVSNWRLINTILHNTSYSIVFGLKIRTVWRP